MTTIFWVLQIIQVFENLKCRIFKKSLFIHNQHTRLGGGIFLQQKKFARFAFKIFRQKCRKFISKLLIKKEEGNDDCVVEKIPLFSR